MQRGELLQAIRKEILWGVPLLDLKAHREPLHKEGMAVEVVQGSLQGVHGILLRKEKRHRLVISVRLIQQAAAVEIDIDDVVPV